MNWPAIPEYIVDAIGAFGAFVIVFYFLNRTFNLFERILDWTATDRGKEESSDERTDNA